MKLSQQADYTVLKMIVAMLICTQLLSCQKDDDIECAPLAPLVDEEPCEMLPLWEGIGFRPSIVDTLSIRYPLVNPKNPDEVIFQLLRDSKVYRLNLATREVNVVLQDGMGYIWPDLGSKDWLLFTRLQNLYKVKTNGDSLTQITFNGVGWRASWNPDGNKYLYSTNLSSGQFATVIANSSDAIVDTLPVSLNIDTDWVTNDTVFLPGRMYVMGNASVTELYELETGESGFVAAISDKEFIVLSDELKTVDVQSGEVVVNPSPKTQCHSYFGIDFSPQKQKLLSSQTYRQLMPDGIHEYYRVNMVWLNLDGTVNEVIDIAPFFGE